MDILDFPTGLFLYIQIKEHLLWLDTVGFLMEILHSAYLVSQI